jgi:hypothetical protein
MRASEHGNLPRWTGRPGFFEIWFLVVFAPAGGRAWWFRYTTFAPRAGPARATLWAAAFDADAPALALKRVLPIGAYDAGDAGRFGIRLDGAALRHGAASGDVAADGHRVAWSLAFTPAPAEARRGPRLLERFPLPTAVSHANDGVGFDGWVEVDGIRHVLAGAPGVQKHLWGTRRVEELLWLYCPRFDEDPQARLEATAVRLDRYLPGGLAAPAVAPVWATADGETLDWCELPALLWNRVTSPGPGVLHVEAWSPTRALTARAWCEPHTLAAWDYRDLTGRDLHVAQSDVASCEVEVLARPHVLSAWRRVTRLTATHAAALEFHGPEPLPGVRYLPWDAG